MAWSSPVGLVALPQPPTHDAMPKTAEVLFTAFIAVPLVVALILAVRQLVRRRDPLLLCCLAGGACAAAFEPIVDVLGLAYMNEHNAMATFTIFDRTMPLYICFVYPWYVGGLGYLAYKLFGHGVTRKMLFQLWALDFVVDMVLETPGILAKTYSYYGHQPFDIWGFPLWWGFVNPVMPMAAGALIYAIRPHLRGVAVLGVIPLIPMADGLANGATAWPTWIALNQDDVSYVWTYLGSLVTLALALYSVWIISLAVAAPTADGTPGSLPAGLRALARAEPVAPLVQPAHHLSIPTAPRRT